jgi:hypothetical protein
MEIDLLPKKKGMTIGNAFMLMISCVTVFAFLAGGTLLILKLSNAKVDLNDDWIFLALVISFITNSLWGYRMNSKELPFFDKIKYSELKYLIIIALATYYLTSVFSEINLIRDTQRARIIDEPSLAKVLIDATITICFVFFQIGIIGHGLLKNYAFQKAILVILFLSICFISPSTVLGIGCQGAILFFIYYRTASFNAVLFTLFFMLIPDYILWFTVGKKDLNVLRLDVFHGNTLMYGIGWIIALLLLIWTIIKLKTNSKEINWRKEF